MFIIKEIFEFLTTEYTKKKPQGYTEVLLFEVEIFSLSLCVKTLCTLWLKM